MITFFNTLGRAMQEFKPLKEGEVRMYTCGPTVWNYPHIGNYRTFLFEDMLRRFLKYSGYRVTQVMNLTDVDDRIIKVCREQNVDLYEFTEKYAKAFFEDLDFLNVERTEYYPRATRHVPEMVTIVEGLLAKKIAYKGEDGSIYYKISEFPGYGKLSGLKLSELKSGARVRQDDYTKETAQDFALWKAWDESDGNIFWEAPSLGRGRPGWHIECSAMSMKYLGETFDIHTSAVDNIFPHHENEIAQSEAFTGKQFARYWLHSEHLLINDQKMAKRLGNFITVKELREKGVNGVTLRFSLLASHYRQQMNFSEKSLEQASSSVKRINEFVARLKETAPGKDELAEVQKLVTETRAKYVSALNNDLDSPSALASVFEFITTANRLIDQGRADKVGLALMSEFIEKDFDSIYGILKTNAISKAVLPPKGAPLLKEREDARKAKDWKRSDTLREELNAIGVIVQDTPQGQKWRLKD
ncbi:MAG: cysteine--tRNA ligase [Nitrososphaerales archaeon]